MKQPLHHMIGMSPFLSPLGADAERYYGMYAGYVRDTNDPDNKGRIRCFCPEIMGEQDNSDHWLDWAMPSFPWFVNVGAGTGQQNVGALVPKVDSGWGVWLMFRQGDIRFPIWTGVWPVNHELDFDNLRFDADTIKLIAGTKVYVGDDTGTEPATLATTLTNYITSNLITWLSAHVHTAPAGGGPTSTPTTLPVPSLPNIKASKVEIK